MPAFGRPTSAASASSLSRRSNVASSPGRPVSAKRGARRVGVAKRLLPRPGDAATCRDHPRSRHGEVRDELLVLVEHLCPDGDAKLDRLARRPVLQRAAAGLTAAGLVAPLHTKGGQIAQVRIRDENDVASRPAVATVWATFRDVLLPAEVQAPVAAAARLDVDLSSIVEHTRTLAAGGEITSLHSKRWGRGRNGPQRVTDELTDVAKRDRPTVDAQGRELGESIEGVIFIVSHPWPIIAAPSCPFSMCATVLDRAIVYGYEIMIRPGRIKGWGMHEQQTDRYLVAAGNSGSRSTTAGLTRRAMGGSRSSSSRRRHPGYSRFRQASGMPTRTGARRMRTSSTSRRIPTTTRIRTNSGSTPTPT